MMLMHVERMLGKEIRECFDWISGTSTGGILALGLTYGEKLFGHIFSRLY